MITGVVLARNEAANIVACLESLRPHVAELLLIDMESEDETRELAQPLVDRILPHRLIPNFDAARNIAISEARNNWLWFLDADERVPDATGRLVNDLVRDHNGSPLVAITIPFKSYFAGKWITHCGWWPGYTMARVLRRPHFQFSERLHGGVQFNGQELRLPPDPDLGIDHFSYRDLAHYVEKFNRYTDVESQQLASDGQLLSWEAAFREMTRDWWAYYEQGQGHQEGDHGWILSWLAGQYRWFSQAKLLDREAIQPAATVPSLDTILDTIHSELSRQRAIHPQVPLGIVWRSPLFDPSGYADDGRIVLRSLATGNREVQAEEVRWSDQDCPLPLEHKTLLRTLCRTRRPRTAAAITNIIPGLYPPDPDAAVNILRTVFETDRIPTSWLGAIEGFDEIWVLSEHNRLSFRQGGVPPEKLRVVGSFVDTAVFTSRGKKRPLPEALEDRFVFLSMFDWQLRKGWDCLLKAYCEEFSPDDQVGLLLKITRSHGQERRQIEQQIDETLAQIGQDRASRPDIVILEEFLDTNELAALYRSTDAFVLASRGEGWGRPYMEAMASGLPTIGTRGTGNLDFMNDKNSLLVDVDWLSVSEEAAAEIPVYRGHCWMEPRLTDLREKMRLVAKDQRFRRKIARQAAADIRAKFDVSLAHEAVDRQLSETESRFIPRELPEVTETQTLVELEGELFASHSFANINEKLVCEFANDDSLALTARRVRHNPTNDRHSPRHAAIVPFIGRSLPSTPDVVIRHAFPPNWETPQAAKWVHIQPWEFGKLPRDWIEPLRDRVNEIWVPSTYVKQVYEESGIPSEKIQVIPWGVDQAVFTPDAPSLFLPTEKTFRFLFVGGTIPRKGIDLLLAAYSQEFGPGDDACLVIKDMGTSTFYRFGNFREQVLELAADPAKPEVVYLDHEMTEGQLASLYTACDCLVAPYRGEGFGLPILESMACGVTPIVPQGGASDDFVSDETAYLLPAELVESEHDWRLCGVPTELAVSVEDLRTAMRQAYEERDETHKRGQLASEHVCKRFTWSKTAEQMSTRIAALAQEPAKAREQITPAQLASVTLCLSFRNDESVLANCLGTLRPFVDEILAIDLGSTDRSAAIAKEYGARVYKESWQDSHADIRNHAISRATSDWILFLEPSEVIDDRNARTLRPWLATVEPAVLGIQVRVERDAFNTQDVRLFRNQNQLVYTYRGCPDVRPSIQHLGGLVADSDVVITQHEPTGVFDATQRLLHLDLHESPADPAPLFSLGKFHFEHGNFFHAECYLHESLGRLQPTHPLYRETAQLLIQSHDAKGDPERAREVHSAIPEPFSENIEPRALPVSPTNNSARAYLGAGTKRLPGYSHVDLADTDGIDLVHDLNELPWPWDDSSLDLIVAEDLVEHLAIDVLQFCNEAWRVLRLGAELFIRTPHHSGDSSWIDPTHRWHLNEQAFHYLDPRTHWGQLYPQYTDRKWQIISLGVRGPQNIHALLTPQK